jgi:8-oxo-dGTP diphosphatase
MTEFPAPILTVDVILLALHEDKLCLGLVRRREPPFQGMLALPGGYVHVDEDADTTATALRVIREKTGLTGLLCEQLATVSGPKRDPRGWSATVVHYALVRGGLPKSSQPRPDDLTWVPAASPGALAFDHNDLVAAVLERFRSRGSWSSLPAFFLPEVFTFTALRNIYEQVLGTALNDSAFRRKIDELNLLEPVAGHKSKMSARPAQLFRLKGGVLRTFDRRI